ncbi:SSI family serine proteinase inhibitor [Streptomyces sp. DT24]|uniref:SSI family serine proteinase inhibitor n=1 Tax=Streptomyces sp. DT24 TaxID=3416520 RepID=UPI003CEF808A
MNAPLRMRARARATRALRARSPRTRASRAHRPRDSRSLRGLARVALFTAALLSPLLAPPFSPPLPQTVGAAAAAGVTGMVPAGRAGRADGDLLLTVSGSENTWVRGVVLKCPYTEGHHPHGSAACAAVAVVHGDLDVLSDDPHACTMEYDPVTATAKGSFEGRPVEWTRTFPNACALDAATGPVFRF